MSFLLLCSSHKIVQNLKSPVLEFSVLGKAVLVFDRLGVHSQNCDESSPILIYAEIRLQQQN